MPIRQRFVLFTLFAILAIPRVLHAGGGYGAPIDPAELQMKDLPEQPGAPACVLYHEEIDDDLRRSHFVYTRIKVLTEAGRKYADVQIPYFNYRGFEFGIADIQGRTIHSDGTVIEFKGKALDKMVVKSKGVKEQMKVFSLPDVQVGSVLEFRYTLDYHSHALLPPHWVIQGPLFERKEHFRFVAYKDLVQTAHDNVRSGVAYTWKLPKGTSVKFSQGNVYDLDIADVPAFVEEERMPPGETFKYSVRFYYGAGSNADQFWKDEGKYWRQSAEQFISKHGAVNDVVGKVTAAGDTPEQKAKKIYAYVATFDNLSYKPRLSDQEMKALDLKDRNVEDIVRQQAGTERELTLLFVAMARAAGMQAYPMWVTDRDRGIFEKNYLSTDQLDAYLAVVTLDNKQVFLDPGTKFCPYGLLYWPHSDTAGLRESGGGIELAQTPMPEYASAVTKRVARLTMNDHGNVDGVVAVGYMGQEALLRRIEGAKTDGVGRTKLLEDEMKSWLPSNAEVTLTQEPDWSSSEKPMVVNFKVSTPFLISGGKRVLLPTNVFQFGRPAMFTHSQRVYPVYLEFPSRELDDIRIKLPDNLQVENLPAGDSNRVDYAYYKVERKQEKNELVITRDFAINSFVFQPTEYQGLKGFYDKMKASDEQQALLKQVPHVAGN